MKDELEISALTARARCMYSPLADNTVFLFICLDTCAVGCIV